MNALENAVRKQPNIVVFMTDQQNASTIAPDSPVVKPNFDRFIRTGMRFDEAYCPAPHCCPSRATFFTGLYPAEHGVWHNVEVNNAISRTVFEGVRMFPEALAEAGYSTVFSGKWHVSAEEGPGDRGFKNVAFERITNYGQLGKGYRRHSEDWDTFYSGSVPLDRSGDAKEFGRILREGYPTYYQFGVSENPAQDTDVIDAAVTAIQEHDGESPLFLFAGPVGPHDPYCPPQQFLDLYDPESIQLPPSFHDDLADRPALYRRTKGMFRLTEEEHRESLRRYYAYCSYEDWLFGRLLDSIREKGMWEDTVVFYLTDHGDYMGAHGLWAKGLPCFREAYSICAAVGGGWIESMRPSVPETAAGTTCSAFVSLADFAPTILELAGVSVPWQMRGRSLVPLVTGSVPSDWRTTMFTQTNGNEVYGIQRAVWDKKWKYVFNSFDFDELYDRENDPHEMRNLASDPAHAGVIRRMVRKMWEFAKETKDAFTCPYIMVTLAPYGPGILDEDDP